MRERTGASEHVQAAAALAALLLATALVYVPALRAGFVWDDRLLVLESPLVRESLSLPEHLSGRLFERSPHADARAYYRPLTTLSLAADFALWGDAPRGFHATNLALHAGVAALAFLLARRAGARPAHAALAAGLFALHPRLSESVAWISGRSDLLAALGVLAALLLHRTEPGAWAARGAAALALLGGLLGKETAIAGAAALVALELSSMPRGEAGRRPRTLRALSHLGPVAAVLAAYALLRAAGAPEGATAQAEVFQPAERVLLAVATLGRYALMLLDPLRPSLRIGLADVLATGELAAGALAAAALVWGALRLRAHRLAPLRLAALVAAAVALAPALHAIPIPLDVRAADRLLYLPVAGLALALAPALAARAPMARLAAPIGCALLAFFALATHLRAREWADEAPLWRGALATAHATDPRPALMLAELAIRRGQPAEALDWLARAGAAEAASQRRRLRTDASGEILGNTAGALAALGRDEEALRLLEELARREPTRAQHHYNLAVLHARAGQRESALAELTRAEALLPGYPAAARLRTHLSGAR
jgi:tetratricopeptide (TPR) repeat protein